MARGFFTKTTEMYKKEDCDSCGMCLTANTPKFTYVGEGKLGILIVGTMPSTKEDDEGDYGYGTEFRFLEKALDDIGINLLNDCYYACALSCRTPRNRTPKKVEVGYCQPRLERFMRKMNPRVVILLGASAFTAVVQPRITGRLKGTPYNKFYGKLIPDQEYGVHIMTTYSVKELMDKREYEEGTFSKPLWERDKAIYNLWQEHLYLACNAWQATPTIVDYTQFCKTTTNVDVALDWIEEAMTWETVAFDYETTGIKPHRKGHKIWYASVSNGEVSYAFPFFEDKLFLRMWKRLMTSKSKKICHNIGYEWLWTNELCGYWPTNMYWDTMLGAHCIHNQKPTGLKFCTYTEFGVIGYDESADKYLRASKAEVDEFGDNAINKIADAPVDEILLYNAMDSLFTYKLYELQVTQLTGKRLEGLMFFMESAEALTKTTQFGFCVNYEKLEETEAVLAKNIDELTVRIMDTEEYKAWPDEEFNYNSGTQLGRLLYTILGYKPTKYTDTGKPSTDVEALGGMDSPMVRLILEQRKLKKLLDTYIHQYKLEMVDGKIHPWFYLNKVETYRSSMGAVNVQNIPKRDEAAKSYITSLIIPRKAHKLVGYDFKSLEVLINACFSGDKALVEYTSDPTKDMHRSSAADIFMLEESDVPKSVRQGIKGAFVFSSFYGSYYKQTAPDCWELAKKEGLLPHLASKGVTTYKQFEDRVKIAEEILWSRRFPTHDKWRKNQWKDYQRQGYLDNLSGFRMQAPMSRNFSFNSVVQGSSYHILQWGFNQVVKELETHNMDTRPFVEIHDAGDFDVNPAEEEMLDYWVWLYFTQKVKEKWPWIVVNLQVEKEAGEIDAPWNTMKGIGYLGEEGKIL